MALAVLYQQIEQSETIQIPAGWGQGRTIFGGLAAAILMYKAVMTIQNPQQQLLSTSVTFVGPVQQGLAHITSEILRQGKSVTTIEVRLWQEGRVQTILLASFGMARASSIEVNKLPQAPLYSPPDSLFEIPAHFPLPECFKHFELRWADINLPCTASQRPDFEGYCRFDPKVHVSRTMHIADLMAIFDIWPPGVLPMFQHIAPASTLTWHVTYIQPLQTQIHDWMKYKVVTDAAQQGYSTEHAYLWDSHDRLIAIARQTVTVFA
jgi:acyl-CoA thioesterase